MPKASEIVNGAFRRLNINPAITAIPPAQVSAAIEVLNDYMMRKAAIGYDMGYTKAEEGSDELGTPDWANDFMKLSLAVLIAPDYGREIKSSLASALIDATSDIDIILSDDNMVYYPANLPIGDVQTWPSTRQVTFGDLSRDLLQDGRRILRDTDGQALSTERSFNE